MRGRRILLSLMPLLGLVGSGGPHGGFPQEAYVWQRVWTPAVDDAVAIAADSVVAWRVLAAETDRSGTLRAFAPDRASLTASGRPVVLVIRIDGTGNGIEDPGLPERIQDVLEAWQAAGLRPAGLEIDHDCATARLPVYGRLLADLKRHLGPTRLSITALPSWIGAPALRTVLATADESVLQVHAVDAPAQGLFDPDRALGWIEAFAAISPKPFRVALPTYGARAVWDRDGRLVAIESETAGRMTGDRSLELTVPPAKVAGLLRALEARPVSALVGIVWFRLPVAGDRRAWSLATWRKVMTGAPLKALITVETAPGARRDLRDLILVNRGDVDGETPTRIPVAPGCAADGINGYRADPDQAGLVRVEAGLLAAGHTRRIGWLRCSNGTEIAHVEN
jgi:hypothetical protein